MAVNSGSREIVQRFAGTVKSAPLNIAEKIEAREGATHTTESTRWSIDTQPRLVGAVVVVILVEGTGQTVASGRAFQRDTPLACP